MQLIICKEQPAVFDIFGDILFEYDCGYDFYECNNMYAQIHGFIGYVSKDEQGKKRWITKEFKEKYFR